MNTGSLPENTSQFSPDPNRGLLEMALGSSMKRLLSVNDAYGSEVLRLAILDELNELMRKCRLDELFMTEITESFDGLFTVSKEYCKKNRVMREALIAEHASLSAFVQRMT